MRDELQRMRMRSGKPTSARAAREPVWQPVVSNGLALPATGFLRLRQILVVIPISRSAWWKGVRAGHYPSAVKLSARVTAWRVEDVRRLIARLGEKQSAQTPVNGV